MAAPRTSSYLARREWIEEYFDRTAAETWARLTSEAPVGRIRSTVREGRDRMRATLIGWRLTQLPKSQALEFLLVSDLRPQSGRRSPREPTAP